MSFASFLFTVLSRTRSGKIDPTDLFPLSEKYFSYCIENYMKDEDLPFYTANGKEAGGFFVATIKEKVVGTVAYITHVRNLNLTSIL